MREGRSGGVRGEREGRSGGVRGEREEREVGVAADHCVVVSLPKMGLPNMEI